MQTKPSIKYYSNAKNNRSPIDLIKYASIELWNRKGLTSFFNNKMGFMRVQEVTMTHNLLYELFKFESDNNIQLVNLFEAKNEHTNGADILVSVTFSKGTLKIPFQAKLLKTYKKQKNGNYKSFHHKNENGLQIDLLNKYAKNLGSYIGFYLFYNFTNTSPYISKSEKEEYYGCSYASSYSLLKKLNGKNNVRFSDIHPYPAVPFYHFFKKGNQTNYPRPDSPTHTFDEVKDFFKTHGMDIDDEFVDNLTFYTPEQMAEDIEDWKPLGSTESNNLQPSENIESFNPKFRIDLVYTPLINKTQLASPLSSIAPEAKIKGKSKEVQKEKSLAEV